MSIKQNGGVFGRNPTFNDVTIEGQLTFDGDIDINSDLKVDGDLEVTGTSKLTGHVGINADPSTTAVLVEHYNDGAAGGTIRIKDRDTQQSANQQTGGLEFYSQDASIPTESVSTAIKSFVASSTGGAYLTFSTTDISTSTLDERLRITSSGNVLAGKDSADYTTAGCMIEGDGTFSAVKAGAGLVLNRLTSDGDTALFRKAGSTVGSISVTASATAYNTSSDYRLKNVTGPLENSGTYIDSLNPVQGTWKVDDSAFVGLLAHEVQESSSTPVATGEKDGEEMQGMDYSSAEIIANLIKEVQLLRTRVTDLEGQ